MSENCLNNRAVPTPSEVRITKKEKEHKKIKKRKEEDSSPNWSRHRKVKKEANNHNGRRNFSPVPVASNVQKFFFFFFFTNFDFSHFIYSRIQPDLKGRAPAEVSALYLDLDHALGPGNDQR